MKHTPKRWMLPSGRYTAAQKLYWQAWDEFVQPLRDEIGADPTSIAYDPDVQYWFLPGRPGAGLGPLGLTLPRWFVRRMNRLIKDRRALLTACKKTLRIVEPLDDPERWGGVVCKILRDAIAKAERTEA